MTLLLTTSKGELARVARNPVARAVVRCSGKPSATSRRATSARLIESYEDSSTAASAVARPAVGPTPFHSPSGPSARPISTKALARPWLEEGPWRVCIRTLTRSHGLATTAERHPAADPAATRSAGPSCRPAHLA